MNKYENRIFYTNDDFIGLTTGLTIGLILWPHGAQRMLGLFGGDGFNGTMNFFRDTLHLP